MRNILFIAVHDIRHQLRQGSTLIWLLVMPPIFFYFIGTVTGGFASGMDGTQSRPLAIEAADPGFIQSQIDLRLRENGFDPSWNEPAMVNQDGETEQPVRILRFSPMLTEKLIRQQQVTANFETQVSALTRDYEILQIHRSLYSALADVVVGTARDKENFSATTLLTLNSEPAIWQLETIPAGKRVEIPSGFEQAIPGILVMFTLLVLLTSGASMLTIERKQGLLRRLASAPISRAEIVGGKWVGRMILALLQIGIALLVGTFLFRMHWGPDFSMVMMVLVSWAAFCASAGLLLGSVATSERQAAGLGVLVANMLAALGGCWWPIEITPAWMQFVQNLMPTGWTMDALHKLISFEAGALSAMPHVLILLTAAGLITLLAINRFRYE